MSVQSVDSEFDPNQPSTFKAGEQYRQLSEIPGDIEVGIEGEPIDREAFVIQASDMWQGVRERVEAGTPKREAYKAALESYVLDSEDPRLGLQAWVLLGAPTVVENDRILASLRADMGQISDYKARNLTKADIKDRVAAACTYNHAIRKLITDSPKGIERPDLVNWLERWSGGQGIWARQTVAGISAEVAVARAAERIEGFRVEESTVEEDLRGADFILVGPNGTRINIDVKSGGQQPLDRVEIRGKNVQIGVEKSEVDGFDIAPSSLGLVLARLRNAI